MAVQFCTLKLVDEKCQVQSPVALVDLAVQSIFRNSRKYGVGSLRKTLTEVIPPKGLGLLKTIGLYTYTTPPYLLQYYSL